MGKYEQDARLLLEYAQLCAVHVDCYCRPLCADGCHRQEKRRCLIRF